jgi:outer membrane protein TolC
MKNTIFCWLMAFSLSASAQKADFSKLISPYDSIPEIVYIEKLVSLAWENYPKNKSFENKRVEAFEKVKLSRNSWMNNLNLFTSFNSNNNTQTQNFAIVPNLGMGLSLNVGSIYSLHGNVKIAKEELKIAENDINAQKLYIRSEVISRYNAMKLSMDLLRFQTEAAEEMRMTVAMVKAKFQKGEISIEEYNKAFAAFTVTMERAITSESNYKTTKANLEELLGIHLEQII